VDKYQEKVPQKPSNGNNNASKKEKKIRPALGNSEVEVLLY
jgi:hypothetical protein